MAQTPQQPPVKTVEVIADGIDGPTIIYTDGTSEFFPADPKDPPAPPQTGDINFEDPTSGFEVWHLDRIAMDHEDLVDASAQWSREQPGFVCVVYDDREVLPKSTVPLMRPSIVI
ncbi:MAG TPA: hypothetical protein VFC03_04720 [Acidimicrobiales bacterium]|nr:hypothetical protein [Acidimicrobiales bacterium]